MMPPVSLPRATCCASAAPAVSAIAKPNRDKRNTARIAASTPAGETSLVRVGDHGKRRAPPCTGLQPPSRHLIGARNHADRPLVGRAVEHDPAEARGAADPHHPG